MPIGMGANGVFKRQNNDAVVPKEDPRTITSEPGTMESSHDAPRLLERYGALLRCFVPFVEPPE